MGETGKVKAKVIGPLSVDGVLPGNVVLLDPRFYDIRQLIDAGHVELLSEDALTRLAGFERSGTASNG